MKFQYICFMPADSSIIAELLIGEWQASLLKGSKIYEFIPDTDIVIYSDHDFPKAESATFTLKLIGEEQVLEIKHPLHPIEIEVYTIVSIDLKKMVWSYLDVEAVKQIKLMRFLG